MTNDSIEKVLSEAADRARAALEPQDAEKGPVGCAVAIFCGSQAILGSSGAIDVAALDGQTGGKARLELGPGESLELTPGFRVPGAHGLPEKRMATHEEIAGVRASRERHWVSREVESLVMTDEARRQVAQRVLETAAELEQLIKNKAAKGVVALDSDASVAAAGTLQRSKLFGHLGQGVVQSLSRSVVPERFAADRAIPDEPAVHVITKGHLEARRAGHPTRLLGPGDDFGLEAAARQGQRRYELKALTETATLKLTRESLRAMADADPRSALAVSQAIAQALAMRLDEAYDWAVKG